MGGVRVFFRVAIRMVHPMQNGVCPGVEEGGALGDKGKGIKEPLPELIHSKHLMRRVPMQEESLRK